MAGSAPSGGGYSASNAASFAGNTLGGNIGPNISFGPAPGSGATVPMWAWVVGGMGLFLGLILMFVRRKGD